MATTEVIQFIDAEIAKLQQARALLMGSETKSASKPGRGRPKGSKNASSGSAETGSEAPAKAKRKLSPEGRKAIADAMKRRWAERRKQAGK